MPQEFAGRLFIASSFLSRDVALKLKVVFEAHRFKVSHWQDAFERSVGIHYDDVVHQQLKSADLAIVVLAPDAKYTIETERGTETSSVPSVNMLFELGFSWGLLSSDRVIILRLRGSDGPPKLPSDLKGIATIDNFSIEEVRNVRPFESLSKIIVDAVKSKLLAAQMGRKIPWLSLINSKFGMQNDLLRRLREWEDKAAARWGAEILEAGVAWGSPDNFVLYTTPTVDAFVEFVTALRREHSGLVRAVDSRMVFPKRFWHEFPNLDTERLVRPFRHLVMLSCPPSSVEPVFQKIQSIAQDERSADLGDAVNITTVGILTGDSDLFFITSSETVQAHHQMISKGIHRIIQKDLRESEWSDFTNTNSLLITNEDTGA